MYNLCNLTKTEKLTESARIIKENLLKILREKSVESNVIRKQQRINKKVNNFINQVGNIDNVSNKKFIAIMLEMCAMFRNAHISLNFSKFYVDGKRFLNQHFFYHNKNIYLIENNKFYKVKNIGGWQPMKICKEFNKYLSYETKEWRDIQLNKMLNFVFLYDFLDIDYEKVELTNGEIISCLTTDIFFYNHNYLPPFKLIDEKFYDFEIIDNHIIKIEYFACSEKNEGDFNKFLNSLKEKVNKTSLIDSYILDIRGNMGGNSEIILPLLEYLKEKNLKGVTLTDNRVFSSGIFVAYYAKKILSTTLIGQSLGQGNARFGQSSGRIELSDTLFIRFTENYFDFTDIFKNKGAIKPDIEIPLTFADILSKKDKTLTYAKKYVENISHKI